MQGEFLQQMKGLAEYLRVENKEREEKLKEQKMNVSAQRIAQAFEDMGPDADAGSYRKLVFDMVEDAAGLDALRENMPLISSLYQDSLKNLEKIKEEKQNQAIKGFLSSQGYNTPSDVEGGAAVSLANFSKSLEKGLNVVDGKRTYFRTFLGDGTLKNSIDVGPSPEVTDDKNFQQAIYLENLRHSHDMQEINERDRLKDLDEDYDFKTLRTRQIAAKDTHKSVYGKTISSAQSVMDILMGNKEAAAKLKVFKDTKKKMGINVGNPFELYKSFDKNERNLLHGYLTESEKATYAERKGELSDNWQDLDISWNNAQRVDDRINYVGLLADNDLQPGDEKYGYGQIIKGLDDPGEFGAKTVSFLKETEPGKAHGKDKSLSNKEWKDWFEKLNRDQKFEIIGTLKRKSN